MKLIIFATALSGIGLQKMEFGTSKIYNVKIADFLVVNDTSRSVITKGFKVLPTSSIISTIAKKIEKNSKDLNDYIYISQYDKKMNSEEIISNKFVGSKDEKKNIQNLVNQRQQNNFNNLSEIVMTIHMKKLKKIFNIKSN